MILIKQLKASFRIVVIAVFAAAGLVVFAILSTRASALMILIALIVTIPFVRVRIRKWSTDKAIAAIRKGKCPTCGYDLRATPAMCPECGKTVPHGEGIVLYEWQILLIARYLLEQRTFLVTGEHDHVVADEKEQGWRDMTFYDATADELRRLGLRDVGSMVDKTYGEFPTLWRNYYRVLVDDDGSVAAVIAHTTGSRFAMLCFQTELEDGSWVVTEILRPTEAAGGDAPDVEGVDHLRFWEEPDASRHLRIHLERLSQHVAKGQMLPRACASIEDFIESEKRLERKRAGPPTSIEERVSQRGLRSLYREGWGKFELDLFVELQWLLREEARRSGAVGQPGQATPEVRVAASPCSIGEEAGQSFGEVR